MSTVAGTGVSINVARVIRVLHVVESGSDLQTERCVEHLSRGLGGGFEAEVRRMGSGGEWKRVGAAVMGLRRAIEFDIVHTWGPRALTAAAMGSRARLIHSPGGTAGGRPARWLRAIMDYRDVRVICATATARHALSRAGIAAERCHVIRPGVESARIRRGDNAEMRAALGLSEEDCVVLAAGESSREANHRDAAWATGIAHVLDKRYKLLLWGRGEDVAGVKKFNERLGNAGMLRVAEETLGREVEFEELPAAADMAIASARGMIPTLPICICMAAGLPIVAAATQTICELLENHRTAMLVAGGEPAAMARRMAELREDGELRRRLSEMARREAYEHFSLTRFLEEHRAVYRQCADGEDGG